MDKRHPSNKNRLTSVIGLIRAKIGDVAGGNAQRSGLKLSVSKLMVSSSKNTLTANPNCRRVLLLPGPNSNYKGGG